MVGGYLLGQEINGVVLLEQKCSPVFLIRQDVVNSFKIPMAVEGQACRSGFAPIHALRNQPLRDVLCAVPIEVITEDPADNVSLAGDDCKAALRRPVIPQQPINPRAHLPFGVMVPYTDLYVLADRRALLLCDRAHDCDQKLAAVVHGVYSLFRKNDRYAEGLCQANIFKAIERISCPP